MNQIMCLIAIIQDFTFPLITFDYGTYFLCWKRDIQNGREISVILLTVVGDGSKDQIYIDYNMGSKLYSFLRKRRFLFCFVYVVLFISLEIMRKHLHQ